MIVAAENAVRGLRRIGEIQWRGQIPRIVGVDQDPLPAFMDEIVAAAFCDEQPFVRAAVLEVALVHAKVLVVSVIAVRRNVARRRALDPRLDACFGEHRAAQGRRRPHFNDRSQVIRKLEVFRQMCVLYTRCLPAKRAARIGPCVAMIRHDARVEASLHRVVALASIEALCVDP